MPPLEHDRQDRKLLLGFILLNLALRLAMIHVNTGEYTDGILQITQFERRDSFWPPLYTALIWLLRPLGVDPILAGRLVCAIASVLILVPLWNVTRLWGGRRAALFALLLYSASPLALRWSLRVMTDMPFLLFLHLSCASLLLFASEGAGGKKQSRRLAFATVWAVAATLSRYHGLMLAPLIGLGLISLWRWRAPGLIKVLFAQLLWLLFPAWLLWQKFGHLQQMGERQAGAWWETLVNYWDLFEMFLYILPYVLTLPVFALFIAGLVKGPVAKKPDGGLGHPPVYAMFAYVTLAVLVAQSVFQSFQERYLLPLLPLALTFAGAGMDRMEYWFSRRGLWMHRLGMALTGLVLLWSLCFGMAVVFLQREAFGDLYEAGALIRSIPNLPAGTRIFTNESYKPEHGMNGIKLAYAAGRPAEMIPDLLPPRPDKPAPAPMPRGSIVALHSAYGGLAQYDTLLGFLRQRYQLRELTRAPLFSTIVPLFPDIMEEPGTHQNPLAWGFRYRPQHFKTQVFVVQ